MRKTHRQTCKLLLTATSALVYSVTAVAEDVDTQGSLVQESGFTILSNATNVTRWGIGVGAGVKASPYKGDGTLFAPIPLISFENKWVRASGVTADLKVGTWSSVALAFRTKFAIFDGYRGVDAPVLNGMQNRKGAFWYGPAIEWRGALGTISGDFLFGGNKGEMANIRYGKPFNLSSWSIEPYVGLGWLSSEYVDYYYGVRPSEVRAGRPAYVGKATWSVEAGTRVNYRLTRHQNVSFDLGVSHLGSGVTESPLVGRRYIPQAKIGYLYQFK